MTNSRIRYSLFALALSCGALTACGGDDDDDNATDAGDTLDGASEFICDPEGANPDMGALLNAPVAADVEVIVKEPQHPGDPGPENLP